MDFLLLRRYKLLSLSFLQKTLLLSVATLMNKGKAHEVLKNAVLTAVVVRVLYIGYVSEMAALM